MGLETSCSCQCYNSTGHTQLQLNVERKGSKNVISCQFPKFLETIILGRRAIGPGAIK